jgi:hypothetical protein
MKTAKQILTTSLFTMTIVLLASLAYKPAAHSSVINPGADLQAITISAQRMTVEQKAAYDRGQETIMTLTITGKAMTAAQKAAYDNAQAGAGNAL